MDAFEWAAWLEGSPVGEWMRSSALAYPVANVLHLLGLVLLVGPILLLDLRLLGIARELDLPALSRIATRAAACGLLLLVTTGVLMFAADAGPLAKNGVMQAKLCFIVLGSSNALVFRALWDKNLAGWDTRPPLLGRVQAFVSIAAWLCVGTLGRWIAYA